LKTFRKNFGNISGRHDVFIKFPAGANRQVFVNSIRFIASG